MPNYSTRQQNRNPDGTFGKMPHPVAKSKPIEPAAHWNFLEDIWWISVIFASGYLGGIVTILILLFVL